VSYFGLGNPPYYNISDNAAYAVKLVTQYVFASVMLVTQYVLACGIRHMEHPCMRRATYVSDTAAYAEHMSTTLRRMLNICQQ